MPRLAALAFGLSAAVVLAADSTPVVKPVMVEPDKLLIADDFATGPAKGWRAGKGKWEAADGAVRGTEVATDMHAATFRRPIGPFRNGVIEYQFRLDGAKLHTLSLNDPKGHVCRVKVTPTGFVVQKDAHAKGTDKVEVLGKCETPIKPGEWHRLTVEFRGPELLARIGDKVAYGKHTAIDVDKSNVGLTVGGAGVSFKEFRAREGIPAKDWEKVKGELLKK